MQFSGGTVAGKNYFSHILFFLFFVSCFSFLVCQVLVVKRLQRYTETLSLSNFFGSFYCSSLYITCTITCPTAFSVLRSMCCISSITVCQVGPKLLCWQSG